MKTVIDNIQEMTDRINRRLEDFLLNHSSLYLWNSPNSGFTSMRGNYAFKELPEEGKRAQSKVLEEYRIFNSLLKTLLKEQPKKALSEFNKAEKIVLNAIEHQHTWSVTPQEVYRNASKALQEQVDLLKNLFAPEDGDVIILPDMNALLYFPLLEKWEFADIPKFTIIITPTILSELDSLKINHRNELVRQKSEMLIKQIKEFRRRGSLNDGVPLVKGKSNIATIATEPKLQDSLDWLDPANNDDRFLATIVEVMRQHPRSVVLAVSRDINFQNKAEFARIPFVEPPEPVDVN